jgi:hypothetical protein
MVLEKMQPLRYLGNDHQFQGQTINGRPLATDDSPSEKVKATP